ncbi:transmembrane protein 216-like [Dysidea avara]|uniref:transmembrane protein 216-like n=1 Tax=Dysidea avara TaxID=196820 RepID=UPI0033177AC2
MKSQAVRRLASLPLQVVLYFSSWYLALYFLAVLSLMIYKAVVLPYPARNFWPEVVLLILLTGNEIVRLFLGTMGNLTEQKFYVLLSLVFVIPAMFGYLYHLLWQTYVLRVEVVLVSVSYFGLLAQMIFGITAIWTFHRYKNFG